MSWQRLIRMQSLLVPGPSFNRTTIASFMRPLKIILVLLTLVAVACSTVTPVPLPVKVQGKAMEPALNEGDRILVYRNPTEFVRGDIVLFYYPPDQRVSYIKRIIGLPGEAVAIREGKVLINGKLLDEPYVDTQNNQALFSREEIKIPAGSYYVMGDNRDNSNDSRSWGTLDRRFIYAKFAGKYYSATK